MPPGLSIMGVVQPPTRGRDPSATPQVSPSATSSPLQGMPVVVRRFSSFEEGKNPPLLPCPGTVAGPAALLGGPGLSRPRTTFLQAKDTTPPPRVLARLPTPILLLGDGSAGMPRVSAHPVGRGTDLPCPRLKFIQQTVFKMYLFPGAAITRSHKQRLMLSQGWRLEAPNRGVGGSLLRAVRVSVPGLTPGLC